MSNGIVVSRLVKAFNAFNAINLQTVTLYFQKSPGTPSNKRGIEGMDYQVIARIGGINVILQTGKTPANGKVEARISPGATMILKIDGAEYELQVSAAALKAKNTTEGRKERLRFLGFQIGHSGTALDGVSNTAQVFEYERSILDFQADQGMDLDAGETTIDDKLKTEVGV